MKRLLSDSTLWIDTNVMDEIYSVGDLHADASKGEEAIERRRMMLQGSLWLAMALDEQAATTTHYEHEGKNTMLKIAPPESDVAPWTSVVLYILRPHVFPRWNPKGTNAGEELPKANQRDAKMVELAKEHSLAIVTRDTKAMQRARREGVPTMTPEVYAETVLPWATARTRFLDRLKLGARSYVASAPRERLQRADAMAVARDMSYWFWKPRYCQ